MKSKILTAVLVILFVFGFGTMVYAGDDISVTIDGRRVEFAGQQPVIVDGRVLVPVRGVFEELGFEVLWSTAESVLGQITMRNTDHAISLFMGANNFYIRDDNGPLILALAVDGSFFATTEDVDEVFISRWEREGREIVRAVQSWLDVPPQIIGDSTMLPIRALVESVGYYVNWDGAAQTVLISSTPFEGQAVAGDGYITIRGQQFETELDELDLTQVDLSNEDIVALRYMINLTTLNLSNSEITDISPLANLINLENLQLNNTHIRNLAPLAGLSNLHTLSLRNNLWLGENLTSANLAPLANLTNLRTLDLSSNQIDDLTSLAGLINLRSLSLGDNQITNLRPLTGMTNLVSLSIGNSELTDLTPMAYLTNLVWVNLHGVPATDITPLVTLPNLSYITWQFGQLADLTQFAGMTNLRSLTLDWHNITDITPLAGLTNLTELSLNGNHAIFGGRRITDITPLSGLVNLESLALSSHQVADITPLGGLTNLTHVDLRWNPITNWSPVAHVEDVEGRP